MENFNEISTNVNHYYHLMMNGDLSDDMVYLYGPYLAMHADTSKYAYTNYNTCAIGQAMTDVGCILKDIKSSAYTCGELKKKIREKIKKTSLINNPFANAATESLQEIYENVRTYQKEKRALEGAILDFSPIEPYQGMLKKADAAFTKESSNVQYKPYRDSPFMHYDQIIKHVRDEKREDLADYIDNIFHTTIAPILHLADDDQVQNIFITEEDGIVKESMLPQLVSKETTAVESYYAMVHALIMYDKDSAALESVLSNLYTLSSKIHNFEPFDIPL